MFTKEKIKDLHYSVNGSIAADAVQAAADEILLEKGCALIRDFLCEIRRDTESTQG